MDENRNYALFILTQKSHRIKVMQFIWYVLKR